MTLLSAPSLPYRRIAGDGAFALLFSALANLCLLGSSLLAVRAFTAPGDSDHFFLLNGVLTLGALLANLGIPSAAAKLLAGRSGADPWGILKATLGLTGLSILPALAAVCAYSAASGRAALERDAVPLCLCLLAFAPGKWAAGVLQGLGRLRPAAAFEAAYEAMRFAVVLWAFLAGRDTSAVAWGWAGVSALHFVIGAALLRSALLPRNPDAVPGALAWRPLISLSLSLFLPFAGLFALTQGLTLLLVERGAPGDATRWAVGLQIASALTLLAAPLGTVLLPHLSRAAAEGRPEDMARAARPILLRTAALLVAAAAGLMLAADPLLAFLFAAAASPGAAVVRWLALLYAMEAFKHALDPLLIAQSRWKDLARLEMARMAAAALLGWWAVERWSLAGAVAALGLAVAVSAAGKWALYRQGGAVALR